MAEAMDINLNELVQRELAFLQADLFLKHQVKVETSLQADLPSIRARYVDFSFALFCLVQNALEAMQGAAGPVLSISTRREGESGISLAVGDRGCGMDQKTARRIFEPFFTTAKGKPRSFDQYKPEAFGLGLTLLRRALKPYGVEFQVKSQPGQGNDDCPENPVGSIGDWNVCHFFASARSHTLMDSINTKRPIWPVK